VKNPVPVVVLILALVVAAAVAAAGALAASGEPREALTRADMAKARSIVLTPRDLPGMGWKVERDTGPDEDPLRCPSFQPDLADLVKTGEAESPNFTQASGTFVSSTATLFRTASQADAGFDRVVKPGLTRCLTRILERESSASVKLRVVSTAQVSHPRAGDELRAMRVRVRVTAGGQSVPVVLDLVLLRVGRANMAFIAVGIGAPFPTAAERSLVETLARRAAAAV
jgi:hypothetical protein